MTCQERSCKRAFICFWYAFVFCYSGSLPSNRAESSGAFRL